MITEFVSFDLIFQYGYLCCSQVLIKYLAEIDLCLLADIILDLFGGNGLVVKGFIQSP